MTDLGFEVKREGDDVLIRDTDSSEWTSGVVWARSSPETVVTMLADLSERLEHCEEALQEISEPIPFMRKRAEMEGARLNGQMAVVLSNDANFLKSIARTALNEESKVTR